MLATRIVDGTVMKLSETCCSIDIIKFRSCDKMTTLANNSSAVPGDCVHQLADDNKFFFSMNLACTFSDRTRARVSAPPVCCSCALYFRFTCTVCSWVNITNDKQSTRHVPKCLHTYNHTFPQQRYGELFYCRISRAVRAVRTTPPGGVFVWVWLCRRRRLRHNTNVGMCVF